MTNGNYTPQIEIFATPEQPLRQTAWEAEGYNSLGDYVLSLYNQMSDKDKEKYKFNPLCSFGMLDLKTGERIVALVCKDFQSLPESDIPGILVFDKPAE